MGKEKKSKSSKVNKQKASQFTDPRFAKIHYDPRFRSLPKQEQKFDLDPRFNAMFQEPSFQGPNPTKLDERGRVSEPSSNPLASLYNLPPSSCVDEQGNFKWDVQSSSESEFQDDLIEEQQDLWEEEQAPMAEQASRRLAIMNCDWSSVKAVDLLALLRSVCPVDGEVLRVQIYPSQFGKERTEMEELHGPTISGDSELQLRAYELEKLKYFYAVAYFDKVETAINVYDQFDQMEFERTSNKLDLRFIPDDIQEFPYEVVDEAVSIPDKYVPRDFFTRALQHTRVLNTWDEPDRQRLQDLQAAFTAEDLEELDLKQYLASGSSSESEGPAPLPLTQQPYQKISTFRKMRGDDIDVEIKFSAPLETPAPTKKKQDIRKKEKEAKQKHRDKKNQEFLELLVDAENREKQFSFNPYDSRFKALYSDHRFSLDPTSTSFKRDDNGNSILLKHQIKRNNRE